MSRPPAAPPRAAQVQPMWPAALSPGLTVGLSLLLGTLGSFAVGFGVLTDCTNAHSCTRTTCTPCRSAQAWLGAGALGQGALLLSALALLVLAALRPATRRLLAPVGRALAAVAVAWTIASTAVASGSH